MLVVGLTGGIAAGKSEVTALLREQGLPVLDADAIAREVVEPGTPTLEALVQAFGPDILAVDGTLRREALGALVFADPEARATLNAITHPVILETLLQRLASLAESGQPLAVVDAALMVESGSYTNYPILVVVHAPDDVRLARLMERDDLSAEEAQQRMDAQMPQAQKMALAHHCIDNGGDRAATAAQAKDLVALLRALARVDLESS